MTSTIHLEFDVANTRYRLVDTTDYISTGITPSTAQMKGLGTIRFNGSIDQQHNTVGDPLVNIALGATTSPWYDLPTDVNGEIVNGTWTVTDYSVRILAGGLNFDSITLPNTIITDGNNWIYDFLQTGNAITLVGGGPTEILTILAITDGSPNVTITTTTPIASIIHNAIEVSGTNLTGSLTHTYSGCVKKTPLLDLSYDCNSGPTGTFTAVDNTSLGTTTLVTRSMSIYPPSLAPLISPVTTAQSSYTFSQLATGTWEASLSLSLSYTQSDGAVILYSIEATDESKVSCTGSLCGLNKCLETLRKMHSDALKMGVSPFQSTVDSILIYFAKANSYKQCGKMDDYYAQIALMQGLLDSIECGCEEDENASVYIFNVDPDTQSIILQLQSDLQYKLNNGIPTVTDDISTGVQVGAIKQDVNTGIEYRCTDNTLGAAVWVVYYDPSTATLVESVTGVTVNNTDPQNPIVELQNAQQTQFQNNPIIPEAGNVQEAVDDLADLVELKVASVTGVGVNNTDPKNPVIAGLELPYVSYVATLNGDDPSDPTPTVIYNNLSGAIVWTRTNFGTYIGTLAGAFTLDKTYFAATPRAPSGISSPVLAIASYINANAVLLQVLTFSGGNWGLVNNALSNVQVKIEVYT